MASPRDGSSTTARMLKPSQRRTPCSFYAEGIPLLSEQETAVRSGTGIAWLRRARIVYRRNVWDEGDVILRSRSSSCRNCIAHVTPSCDASLDQAFSLHWELTKCGRC